MNKIVLECCAIKKSYRKGNKKLIVLREVNYCFKRGHIYAIVGKSGAGKTTLINILGLLKKADEGNVIINGINTSKLNDAAISKIRNTNLGFIFQSFYLNPLMTAEENIKVPMYINDKYNNEEIEKRTKELLKQMDLEDRSNHYPNELSGGEQQRIAIARALANNPDIILADEPTGSLDPENEENILEILQELKKKGKCIIIVTHSKVVREYADTVLKIDKAYIKEEENVKNSKNELSR